MSLESTEVGVVYNACYGGFSLSDEAHEAYLLRKDIPFTKAESPYGRSHFYRDEDGVCIDSRDIPRDDPVLVEIVTELGSKANGECARLQSCYLSAGTCYRIDDYDGMESVNTRDDYSWHVAGQGR